MPTALRRPYSPTWWSRVLALAAVTLSGACGAPPSPPPVPPADVPDRAFLLDPAASSGLPADSAARRRLEDAFARLIDTGDAASAQAVAEELLAEHPGLAPAEVLAAQATLVAGRHAEARVRVEPVVAADPDNAPAALLLGRAAELTGDVVAAYSAYRALGAIPAARGRANTLEPKAWAAAAANLRAALGRGNLPEAEAALGRLREWAPESKEALLGEQVVAAAKRDGARELAAVRRLSRIRPESNELLERQAVLEVESGDAGAGVAIFQRLVEAQAGDARLRGLLDWAKYRWRLELLPPAVRRVADKPQLDRADLATLLYWLAPGVRRGRANAGRIASDVLDHPRRDEIVRVVNQGLMDLDETLHRFAPGQTAKRGDALRAAVLLIGDARPNNPCLGSHGSIGRLTREVACAAASACGLLPSPGDCVAAAPLSGAEAVEWIRLASALIGNSPSQKDPDGTVP